MPLPSEAETAVDRCHWYRDGDGDGEILIPMCMGSAINGPEQCTCDVPESTIERVTRERDAARAEVARLHAKAERRLEQQLADWNRMTRLRARIDELEAAQSREEDRA